MTCQPPPDRGPASSDPPTAADRSRIPRSPLPEPLSQKRISNLDFSSACFIAVYVLAAMHLRRTQSQEAAIKYMILEGVLAIQAGENPRLISDRLMTSVPPAQRGDREKTSEDGPSLAEAA